MRIFVYGTLKQSYGNNFLLHNAKFIGNKIAHGLKLYYAGGVGSFPVSQPSPENSVLGEEYDISGEHQDSILRNLDRLEGEGYMYNRVEIEPGLFTYIGHEKAWTFNRMRECPNENGVYHWNRDHWDTSYNF